MSAPESPPKEAADPAELRRVGLCARCKHARVLVSGKGSRFTLCQAPGYPKYPQLPRLACAAHQEIEAAP